MDEIDENGDRMKDCCANESCESDKDGEESRNSGYKRPQTNVSSLSESHLFHYQTSYTKSRKGYSRDAWAKFVPK